MECNICLNKSIKLIKCKKCSFINCEDCITKLNNIELQNDKIGYYCCVCKSKNRLKINEITDINIMKSLYNIQVNKLLELENDIILLSNIILIYNAPVISNDNVTYFKNSIIALKTIQDNNTITLELYNSTTIDFDNRITMFNENKIEVKNYFIYSTADYDYTLLKHIDFYELINNCSIDFV